MKSLVSELVQRIDNRYSIDSKDMSMGDWICQNTHLRGRPFSFDRYPFQKAITDDMHPNMDVVKPSQVGLALALDTPIPTPMGWTTMGDLQVGDFVYDEQGAPTRVEYVSSIYTDHPCYEVEFDTGEIIVADGQHRWFVDCDKAFNAEGLQTRTGPVLKGSDYARRGVIRTELLARIIPTQSRHIFSIPTTKPLWGTDHNLPFHPYALGLVLGEGRPVAPPLAYLRAPIQERQEMLRGVFEGREYVRLKDPDLRAYLVELIHSLGLKAQVWGTRVSLYRKAGARRIIAVRPTGTVDVRCISVDSPEHLFLAGRGMIPTHNTEVQVRKSMAFLARNRGTSLIFTLPTDPMFERMSSTRILPLVKEEKVFNLDTGSGEKSTRSKGLIQIGASFLYVTGAKENDATSIAADAVFNDEIDLTDQQMLALFNSRMQNSNWKISQRFSTPTFHSFGIDAGYTSSDQHEYMMQCDACNHWNIPVFSEKFVEIPGMPADTTLLEIDEGLIDTGRIDLINSYVCCEKCRAPLDLGRTEKREWVARFASRTHHRGYRVSPFSTDRLKVEYIVSQMLQYRTRDYMRGWHNTVLGQAYNDGSARLTDAEINACFTPHSEIPVTDKTKPTWIGVDVGKTCHMMVSQGDSIEGQHVIIFKSMPVERLIEEVGIICSQYNVIGGSCDRHPYTPTANELRDETKGKVLPVEYRGQREVNLVKDELTKVVTHGQVNRTTMIDELVRLIRKGRIKFSGYGNQKSIITDHLKDMVRDETPDKAATWVKLTGNDHYFHAGVFLVSGMKVKELEYGVNTDHRALIYVGGSDFGVDMSSPFRMGSHPGDNLGQI